MTQRYDAVIIGGGIVGWSAAYRLIRHGARVAVVDEEFDGRATSAGAGIVSPGSGIRGHTRASSLTKAAVGWYATLTAELSEDGETDTGFASPGTLFIATDQEEHARLPEVHAYAERLKGDGVKCIGEISAISGREAKELFPPLADIPGGLFMSEGSRVDGRRLAGAMQRAAIRRGATKIPGTAVTSRDTLQCRTIAVDSETLSYDSLLVAAGAWTHDLMATLGINVPVAPQRGQILHLAVPSSQTSAWPVIHAFHNHYLLAFPPDRVVVGATREDNTGFDYRMTAGGVRQELNEALRVAPGLADATLVDIRIGFRPMSIDGLPILGRVPQAEHVYVATGHGPSGLTLGAVSGAAVADSILGNEPVAPLEQFSLARFG